MPRGNAQNAFHFLLRTRTAVDVIRNTKSSRPTSWNRYVLNAENSGSSLVMNIYAFVQSCLRTGLNIELNHRPNLERLVLGCIDADFCNQILILLHFSRSTRLAFLCTAPISKIQSKFVTNFAKLNIEYSIGTAQFSQENCYFSPKLRWNFVGISRTCSRISKLIEECRKFANFWKILVKFPQLIGKFNRQIE